MTRSEVEGDVPKLVNLGSLCIDHVYRVRGLARAGETVASRSHEIFAGGKGLNQSLAASRAGATVRHVGCVGTDGRFLLDTLEEGGVDASGVRVIDDDVSGHAVIQVSDAGENAIVIAGGANRRLTPEDIGRAFDLLEPGDWLLLQNEINDLPAVLELLDGSPARVAFNVAPVDGREQTYDLSRVDLLIVNDIEARALARGRAAQGDDTSVALELSRNFPAMDVVLTAGPEGLVHARAGQLDRIGAFEVAAVDETAAGDAFIGYLVAGLLAGRSLTEALRTASAAGALAVTVVGAASSIPTPQSVATLLEGQPAG